MGDVAGVVAGDVSWRWRWLGVVMVDAVYALGALDPPERRQLVNFKLNTLITCGCRSIPSTRTGSMVSKSWWLLMKSRSRLCDKKKTKENQKISLIY
jgi:hypothetical protein